MQDVAAALARATMVLSRRPAAGVHDDAPGFARWLGGLRAETSHASGRTMLTDMATELGGCGDQVSPGWMVRSGLAACTVTSIATVAAQQGVELDELQVRVTSRSDTRGYLGMVDADGAPVYAGPGEMRVHVRISARGVPPERLNALVKTANARAPMTAVVEDARALELQVEVISS